jgi:DNA-binding NtrC family response regulator
MLQMVARVAPSEATVLLLGESGSGKELVARAIHDSSRRVDKPFVALDCSGLTETLFESELFGHERGAFTGATSRRVGLIEAACGGTLFLDEVGDIPLVMQVKLLRLLETGIYRRVGSVALHKADIRLISATHRNLRAMVESGSFRQDLYFRLNTFPVELPPLRARLSDVPVLAQSLLTRVAADRNLRFSDESIELLRHYGYPGNVRELRNIIERASLLCDGEVIEPSHLPEEVRNIGGLTSKSVNLADMERQTLETRLAHHQGSRKMLADELGISERTLYRRLKQLMLG